jgi:hypothetical protein
MRVAAPIARRRIARGPILRMAGATALLLASGLAGCGPAAQAPPFQPLADVHLLMNAVVDPQADIIWDSVRWIVTEQGTEEIRPRTEEEWLAVRNSAVTLAEAGNLLMMPPRARPDEDWMKAARALIDTSATAVTAAEAKDADRLFEVGGHIYNACTNCHQKFLTEPPATAP